MNSSVSLSLKIRGRSPNIFRFDETRECFEQLQKRRVIGCFCFLIKLFQLNKIERKVYVNQDKPVTNNRLPMISYQ